MDSELDPRPGERARAENLKMHSSVVARKLLFFPPFLSQSLLPRGGKGLPENGAFGAPAGLELRLSP